MKCDCHNYAVAVIISTNQYNNSYAFNTTRIFDTNFEFQVISTDARN